MWEPLYQDEGGGFPVKYAVKHYLQAPAYVSPFFFQGGGGKKTPSRLSHFYQPDFPIFPTFWDKKTQPSFLAVICRHLGL